MYIYLSVCRSVLGRVDPRSDDSCMMLFCIFLNQGYSFSNIYICMFPEYTLLGTEQLHKNIIIRFTLISIDLADFLTTFNDVC